jgi:hypothetical protein
VAPLDVAWHGEHAGALFGEIGAVLSVLWHFQKKKKKKKKKKWRWLGVS